MNHTIPILPTWEHHVLLTNEDMKRCDAAAVQAGVPVEDLMERAGTAVARAAAGRWPRGTIIVLCGPGHNGGDGLVAARLLLQQGRQVEVYRLESKKPSSDMYLQLIQRYRDGGGVLHPLRRSTLEQTPPPTLMIDALFGAGLRDHPRGEARHALTYAYEKNIDVLAVDMPSGVDGDTGQCAYDDHGRPIAFTAQASVTFFRRKPGHCLYPGQALCGDVILADIGIPDDVLPKILSPMMTPPMMTPPILCNHPDLWRRDIPQPQWHHHKYSRGHVMIVTSGAMPGATILAASAAARSGAGIVTVIQPADMPPLATPAAIVTRSWGHIDTLVEAAADPKVNALLIGPGFGRGFNTGFNSGKDDGTGFNSGKDDGQFLRSLVTALCALGKPILLDADALSVWQDDPARLRKITGPHCLITPHAGEWQRILPPDTKSGTKSDTKSGTRAKPMDKITLATQLAQDLNCTVLLKGADTVICGPKGRGPQGRGPQEPIIIEADAPYHLATAGSGDVLAGIAASLLSTGMPPLIAAAMAVRIHAQTARISTSSLGLQAQDWVDFLPQAWKIMANN